MPIDQLVQEPFFNRVIAAEKWDFRTLDHSKIKEEMRESADALYTVIQHCLGAPYLIDCFQDHTERRTWEDTLIEADPTMRKIISYNALGVNSLLNPLVNGIIVLYENCLLPEEQWKLEGTYEAFIAMKSTIIPPRSGSNVRYSELNTDEKLQYVQELKKRCYNLVSALFESQ